MVQKITKNKDLLNERNKCTFNTEELTNLLDGGVEKTKQRRNRENFFLNDPELFNDKVPGDYLSHKEKYEEAVRKACIVFRKVKELQDSGEGGVETFLQVIGGPLGSALVKEGNPFTLHYVMFIPTLMGQGTLEQQAKWIQKAWSCSILGTYAQTEMGHGTFIRGLETTAHYDPIAEEFVLNSPTLTSYKWWPGGLGHTSNYAIVVAQLYTQGKCHGIHPFIVQLRDEETHEPMPGIKIGEIGTKLGMNTVNNGYLGFDNVRIPRENMLMKNNKVLKDGTYVSSPSSKLTYGTMIFVRVALVSDVAYYLSKAVTIATRYSAVRRQCQMNANEKEVLILDYLTQQYKLFPNIATVFALKYCSKLIWEMYNTVTSEIEQGTLDRLPELHALSCCLKAVSTSDAAAGVEKCRLACGGHGYMTSSNFPTTYGLVTAACTYEGENTVLLLQTARYLMKAWQQYMNNEDLPPTISYLKMADIPRKQFQFTNSVESIITALKIVAARKVRLCAENMQRRLSEGKKQEVAWNETSLELVAAAEIHCRLFLVENFSALVDETLPNLSSSLQKVMKQLMELYAVDTALKLIGDFIRYAYLNDNDLISLQKWLEDLLLAIRPNAVGIVDSFDLCDKILGSVLGVYDGDVYQRLFDEANKSPLNQESVNESFHKYLKPFLKSSL